MEEVLALFPLYWAITAEGKGQSNKRTARATAGRSSASWDIFYHGVGYSRKTTDSHKLTNTFATGGDIRCEATARRGNLRYRSQVSDAKGSLGFGAKGSIPS